MNESTLSEWPRERQSLQGRVRPGREAGEAVPQRSLTPALPS